MGPREVDQVAERRPRRERTEGGRPYSSVCHTSETKYNIIKQRYTPIITKLKKERIWNRLYVATKTQGTYYLARYRKYSPTSNIQGMKQLDNHHMATVTEASGPGRILNGAKEVQWENTRQTLQVEPYPKNTSPTPFKLINDK